jgi:hypothetical protein
MGAPITRIGVQPDFFEQVQGFFDLSDHAFAIQNALVSQYRKALVRCVEHHSPARIFFILGATGNSSAAFELCPNINVAAGVCQAVAVWLSFAHRRTVENQLAIDKPKDSKMWCSI